MTLLNKFFIDSFPYFNKKEVTIPKALMVTDILLLGIEVNYSKDDEFYSYLDNFVELNNLLANYIKLEDKEEAKFFSNETITLCKNLEGATRKRGLTKFITQRFKVYETHYSDLVELVKEMKGEIKLKAA